MISSERELDESERLDWLRLIRSENVGPRTFKTLLDRYATAGSALQALPDLVKTRRSRDVKICSRADAEAEWSRAKKLNIRFVASCEPGYPEPLRNIDSPPPLIAVAGQVAALKRPAVAIVGSRNASASGLVFTERLAQGLAAAGYLVVSGLARGIDVKAHMASLQAGTLAVLAGGHDHIYPSEHEGLARRICESGALISEMPLGWEPRARDFPRRNRIVAGLSLGVVVVEASRRSGSLITARFANEQGREVFAVPGSPLDARSEGTNDLIRQGATLCTSADDVVAALMPVRDGGLKPDSLGEPSGPSRGAEPLWDELDLFDDHEQAVTASGTGSKSRFAFEDDTDVPTAPIGAVDEVARRVASLLGPTAVHVDEVIRASGLAPSAVRAALVELELHRKIVRHDGNRIALAIG